MPRSNNSVIKTFIMEAIAYSLYPETIFMYRERICIRLMNQHNRERARETTQMLKDYAKLKPRRDNDKSSDRQRFLQALKRSPYIVILPHSTPDVKYICLKNQGNVPELGPVAGPLTNSQDDAGVVPEVMNEEPMETSPSSPLLHEDEMEVINTPSDVLSFISDSPLSDLDDLEMLIGSENLVDDPKAPLTACSTSSPHELFNEDCSTSIPNDVFDENRQPNFGDLVALEDCVVGEMNSEEEFPADYDPEEDFLNSYTSVAPLPQQEVHDVAGNSAQRYRISGVQPVVISDDGSLMFLDESMLGISDYVQISLTLTQ